MRPEFLHLFLRSVVFPAINTSSAALIGEPPEKGFCRSFRNQHSLKLYNSRISFNSLKRIMQSSAMKSWVPIFILLISLLGIGQAFGQQVIEGRSIGALQNFGRDIDIQGDYAVVGAPGDQGAGWEYLGEGRAFIFKYDNSQHHWQAEDTLLLPAATGPNKFGYSVAIAGDYVAIAAPFPSENSGPAVYIFHRSGAQWNYVHALARFSDYLSSDSYFGIGLDMDGEHLIVGDPSIKGREGSAAVYIRKNGEYELEAELIRATREGNANNNYGEEVAIAGDYAAVGEWLNDPSGPAVNMPTVNIFRKGSNGWERLGSDNDNYDVLSLGFAPNAEFGYALDFNEDGSLLLIGAPGDDEDGKKAYLYELDESIPSYKIPFELKFTLEPSAAVSSGRFASTVSLSGNTALVGAPFENQETGAAYLYHIPTAKPDAHDVVHEDVKLNPYDASNDLHFGLGASLYNNRLLLGAPAPESTVKGFVQEYNLLPKSPVNFQPMGNSIGGNISLQWESPSGNDMTLNDPFAASSYLLFINRETEGIEVSATSYTDQELKPGEIRSYGLLAKNKFGVSDTIFTAGQNPGDGKIAGIVHAPEKNGGSGIGNVRMDMSYYGTSLLLSEPASSKNRLVAKNIDDFPADAITVEFWAKPKKGFTHNRIMLSYSQRSSTNALVMGIYNDKLWVYVNGHEVTSPLEVIADEWHHYAMSWAEDTLRLYRDNLLLHTQALSLNGEPIPSGGTLMLGQEQDCQGGCLDANQAYIGWLDELRIWKTARDSASITGLYDAVLDPQLEANKDLLLYYRFDEGTDSESRAIFDQSVLIEEKKPHPALIHGHVAFQEDTPPLRRFVYTDHESSSLGHYQLNNLYYDADAGTDFTITPFNDGTRIFTPETKTVHLNSSNKQKMDVKFSDESFFKLTGRIYFNYQGGEYPARNVLVYAYKGNNSALIADSVRTDQKGVFTFTLQSGNYRITPEYADHVFASQSGYGEVNIPEDSADSLFFLDTTTRSLSGKFVGGSCDIDVGGAGIEIKYGQFSTIVNTTKNQDGIHTYAVDVPALINDSIQVEIKSLENKDLVLEALVQGKGGYLQARQYAQVDSSDAVVNFFYHSESQLVVSSPQLTKLENCGKDLYLISEGDVFTFTLEAYEIYNGIPCKLDSGAFAIFDDISDRPDSLIYIEKADSIYTYTIRAGNPNLIGGGAHPYQKSLQVDLRVPLGKTVTKTIWAIVEGNTPRVGQPFVTVNPSNFPLMILRDPPGDRSYSYLEKGFTLTRDIEVTDGGNGSVGAKVVIGDPDSWPVFGSVETNLGFEGGDTESFRFSMSTNQRIATNDGGKPGKPSDVFIGTAMNILYGITDVLEYNKEICEPSLTQQITWFPGQIKTTYIHSYDYIKNSLIPELKTNRELSGNPVRKDSLSAAIHDWRNLISISDFTSDYAKFPANPENITFDGDVGPREESTTITKSKTDAYYFTTTFDLGIEVGYNVTIPAFGVPIKLGSGAFTMQMGYNYKESKSTTKDTTYTVGYVLDDDDSGDRFSVDVTTQLEDNHDFEGEIRTVNTDLGNTPLTNTTPTFRLVGGKSSAPYEGGLSVPRDSAQLIVTPRTQVNVPENEAAVFTLNVGNLSQSGEGRDIVVRLLSESNPDGAIITSGSGVMTNGILMTNVTANESQTITFTVKRGPNAYRYENLKIFAYAPSEFDQYQAIGSLALSDTVSFSVYFDAECKPSSFFYPQNNWIANSHNHDTLKVVLEKYVPEITKTLEIQLKRLPTGSWTTLKQLKQSDLTGELSVQYLNIKNLQDGRYQLRTVTECGKGKNYSEVLEGVIDRQAPMVLQRPLPDDGVLAPEDMIAVYFGEDVDPTTITPQNFILTNTATGDTLSLSLSHDERSVYITPQEDYQQLENAKLQVSAVGVADIYGNVAAPFNWLFTVNQNPVTWVLPRTIEYMSEGDVYVFDAQLYNGGAEDVALHFSGLPSWLEILTQETSIAAGENMFINFKIDKNAALVPGKYEETITLETDYGSETMDIIINVSCPHPAWEINPAAFTQSMVINAGIYAEDISFAEPNDLLAAFVGDELRGVTEVFKLIPDDEYVGFLTVYGNGTPGEEVSFKLWDASACEILPITATLPFENNAVKGNAGSLEKLTVEDAKFLSIPLSAGVNWISFNLEQKDMSLNNIVQGIGLKDGDIISSMDGKYAQFVSFEGWHGTLDKIKPGITYKLHVNNNATLQVKGKPAKHPITIVQGWNPFGFLGQSAQPLDQALATYGAQENDIIRSQSKVATFSGGQWQGDLQVLEPGKGYFLKSQNGGMVSFALHNTSASLQQKAAPGWEVDPAQYSMYMNITGILELNGVQHGGPDAIIGVFKGDECRGVVSPVLVMNKWIYFLTAYANSEDDTLTFKVYSQETEEIKSLEPVIAFRNDGVEGGIHSPFVFSRTSSEVFQLENVAPEAIEISDTTITSGEPEGSVVALLLAKDVNNGDKHTFSLVEGEGSNDNSKFSIQGQKLKIATSLQFSPDKDNVYSIRVLGDDGRGGTVSSVFHITVTNAENHVPTKIRLSNHMVLYDQNPNTTVGVLHTEDEDGFDTHSYRIQSINKDAASNLFQIEGNKLTTGIMFSEDMMGEYEIVILSNDGNGGEIQQTFTISVTNRITGIEDALDDGFYLGDFIPNPTQSKGSFTYRLPANSKVMISIIDMMGKVWKRILKEQTSGSYQISLDLSDLPQGVYIYKIKIDGKEGGSLTKRIIKL